MGSDIQKLLTSAYNEFVKGVHPSPLVTILAQADAFEAYSDSIIAIPRLRTATRPALVRALCFRDALMYKLDQRGWIVQFFATDPRVSFRRFTMSLTDPTAAFIQQQERLYRQANPTKEPMPEGQPYPPEPENLYGETAAAPSTGGEVKGASPILESLFLLQTHVQHAIDQTYRTDESLFLSLKQNAAKRSRLVQLLDDLRS